MIKGIYLSSPITEKKNISGSANYHIYASGEMQG